MHYKNENKVTKGHSTIEMVSISCETKPDLNARIQKALGEKSIDPSAYEEKYLKRKYCNTSINVH